MTPHIEANPGDYAETVLLPGDPERAEWMAQTFLDAPRCVNRRRGALAFTGTFRGNPVSVHATGIGVSSFLIYAHELITHLGARTLIRTGTCGSLSQQVELRSLVISGAVMAESAESGQVFGLYGADAGPDGGLLALALEEAGKAGMDHHAGLTVSSDIFYHPKGQKRFTAAQERGALSVDMETSALYHIAAHFGVRALSICTVVDNVATGEETDYSERQALFANMAKLAFAVAARSQP